MLCFTLVTPFVARLITYVALRLLRGKKSIWNVDLEAKNMQSTRWLQYGFWISFLDEAYLFLLFCACLNLKENYSWINAGDSVNTFLSILLGLVLVIFPIFVAFFYSYQKNYDKILKKNEDFAQRYGSIVQNLNFKR